MLYRMDNAGDGRWRLAESDVQRHEAVDVASQASVPGGLQERMTVDQELAVHVEMGWWW